MAPIKVAVLDDYQGFSKPHYAKLDSDQFEVTHIKETLLPYSHKDTPQSAKDELVKRLEPFQVIGTMRERTPFPADLIQRLPNLKLLLTTGKRNAALDLPAFKERGIPVTGTISNLPVSIGSARLDSTTQHCVTMIMALARGIAQDDLAVKTGGWQSGSATGLAGRTLGVVGLGRLGVNVARIMHLAFNMKVIAWSTNLTQEVADEKAQGAGLAVANSENEKTFKVVSKDELFSTADVISVHLVLSSRSRGIIGASELSKMQPSALLVNTSRGPLITEEDLLKTVKAGSIRGVALDVFDIEPLPASSEWRSLEWGKNGTSQVLLTPHMGYVEEPSLSDWYSQQVENIQRWARGEALVERLV
ncbi:D-3-phosphoglycerate dehydrogenase [Paramyrothecium foliicola]|nr:D-3-phosphoglycerate dehydrogenase [Paramyrothecium foliicola]